MPRIISIAMQKGGSGKTTTCVNLAGTLAQLGKQVLVIDLDSQCTATSWLRALVGNVSVANIFTNDVYIDQVIVKTEFDRISVVAGSEELEEIVESQRTEDPLLSLSKSLKDVTGFDFVLIDSPPHLGLVTRNGLVAAEEVLIPVELRDIALPGLFQVFRSIDKLRQEFNPSLSVLGVLPNRLNNTRHAQEALSDLRRRFSDYVLNTTIRDTIQFSDAFKSRMPINHFSPKSSGAKDFQLLAKEILSKKRATGA